MYKQLLKLLENAYAPYSKYRVACIVETKNGNFEGTNVENAAFPLSRCAEQVAICSAISRGNKEVTKLHLLTDSENETFGTPCGGCRQIMAEFMNKNSIVVIYNKLGKTLETTMGELLPMLWDKSNLNL